MGVKNNTEDKGCDKPVTQPKRDGFLLSEMESLLKRRIKRYHEREKLKSSKK